MSHTTVAELIENLQKNYEPTEPIAYTVYSVGDVLDHHLIGDPKAGEIVWKEIVESISDFIEGSQEYINDHITEQLEEYGAGQGGRVLRSDSDNTLWLGDKA